MKNKRKFVDYLPFVLGALILLAVAAIAAGVREAKRTLRTPDGQQG